MVSCIVYESDLDTTGDADAWASPKFFLDIKKGDSEDHALLLCNLFLGLSIDSYVCCGRANIRVVDDVTDESSIVPSEEIHSWVMTRKADGSVTFWESGTGKEYTLLKRWGGSDENQEEDSSEEEEEEEDGVEEEQADDNQSFAAFYEEDVTLDHKQLKARLPAPQPTAATQRMHTTIPMMRHHTLPLPP